MGQEQLPGKQSWYLFRETYHLGPFSIDELHDYYQRHQGKKQKWLYWNLELKDWIEHLPPFVERDSVQTNIKKVEKIEKAEHSPKQFEQEREKIYHQMIKEMNIDPYENRPLLASQKNQKYSVNVQDWKGISLKWIFYACCILSCFAFTFSLHRFMNPTMDISEGQQNVLPSHLFQTLGESQNWVYHVHRHRFEWQNPPIHLFQWDIHIKGELEHKEKDIQFQAKLGRDEGGRILFMDRLIFKKGAGLVPGFYRMTWNFARWNPPSVWEKGIYWLKLRSDFFTKNILTVLPVSLQESILLEHKQWVSPPIYLPVGGLRLEDWKSQQVNDRTVNSQIHEEKRNEKKESKAFVEELMQELSKLFFYFEKKQNPLEKEREAPNQNLADQFYKGYFEKVGSPLQDLYKEQKNIPHMLAFIPIYNSISELAQDMLNFLRNSPPTRQRREAVLKSIQQRLADLSLELQKIET